MANPLGISTGQGKGLAQVFGDTYNDYYKEKADEGAKKKAELEAAMAKSSAGVWDRDLGLFKPMREDLRKYVQDNARDIIDGKFDANVGWQAKQDELLQFINSSKAAKTFYENTLKLYNNNPEKYSDLSKEDILKYAATPGDFSSNIILEGKFDSQASKKAMLDALSKVQYNTQGIKEMTLPSGKKYAVETSSQRKEAAKEILDSQRDFDLKNFPRQAKDFWTQQEYDNQLAALERSLGSKTVFKEEGTGYNSYAAGLQEKIDLATALKRDTVYAQKYIPGKTEQVLQKWAALNKNIIDIQHSESDPVLKKKYPGGGGIVIREDRNGVIKETFVPSSDYETILSNLWSTKRYNNLKQTDLDRVKAYELTSEEAKISKSGEEKSYAKPIVNDVNSLLTKLPDKTVSVKYVDGLGLTGELFSIFKNKIYNKQDSNGKIGSEAFLETVKEVIIPRAKDMPITKDSDGNMTGGKLVDIKTSGDEIKFFFSGEDKGAVKDKHNYMTFDKTKGLDEIIQKLLTGSSIKENNNVPLTKEEKAAAVSKKYFNP